MHPTRQFPGRALALVLFVAMAIGISACAGQTGGSGGAAAVMSRLAPLAKQCQGPVTGVADIDESGSDRRTNNPLIAPRLAEIRALSDEVAACGGDETIMAFSSSMSDSTTLATQSYSASFGTLNARLLHNDKLETSLMDQVQSGLGKSFKQVGSDGTDVLGQFTLVKEVGAQSPGDHLVAVLLTDGIATAGPVRMGNPSRFTLAVAEHDARTTPLPSLKGAQVSVIGVGKTAAVGQHQPGTQYTDALLAFYQEACTRMGARCNVTSTYGNGD
jgi:hypothetical protein